MKKNNVNKTAILALSAIFAASSFAHAADNDYDKKGFTITHHDGTVINLPHCKTPDGREVRYSLVKGGTEFAPFRVALSGNSKLFGPLILLDTNEIAKHPKLIAFFAEHECGHWELGHIDKSMAAGKAGRGLTQEEHHQYEFEADCHAVKETQRKYGFGEKEIRQIFNDLPENLNDVTHPKTEYRVERALSCLQKAPAP